MNKSQTTLDLMRQLENTGLLAELYRKGLLPIKLKSHYEICLHVERDMEINKSEKTIAVQHVADQLHIHERTVWKALNKMGQ